MSVRSWFGAALRFFGWFHKQDAGAAPGERGQEPGQRVWRCWIGGCDFRMPIAEDQIGSAGFCKVHHLIKYHGLTPEAVIEKEPGLVEEVEGYCEVMGIR